MPTRLDITGANAGNAMIAAALAAQPGEPMRMTHVLQSARTEYARFKKPLTEIGKGVGR